MPEKCPLFGLDRELLLARAQRTLLVFAIALAAILYLDRVCISQAQQLISEELGVTNKQMGVVMSLFGIAYGLFEIPDSRRLAGRKARCHEDRIAIEGEHRPVSARLLGQGIGRPAAGRLVAA